MTTQFKTGDIVQLKSGGPAMTVVKENEYNVGEYNCVWFKGASQERGMFNGEVLKLYVAPKK